MIDSRDVGVNGHISIPVKAKEVDQFMHPHL